MRPLAKMLLTLLIGLVLVLALSAPSQTALCGESDCRDCHKAPIYDAWSTHHPALELGWPTCCHPPTPPTDCLLCHVATVE
jgi:hypothetical protein